VDGGPTDEGPGATTDVTDEASGAAVVEEGEVESGAVASGPGEMAPGAAPSGPPTPTEPGVAGSGAYRHSEAVPPSTATAATQARPP
jgi:hypothetical protein